MTETGTGVTGDPYVISAAPIINPACTLLTCGASGLCVDPTHVTVLDTSCLNATITGAGTAASPYVISVDPIIAPECNGLECGASGLSVPPSSDSLNSIGCGSDGRLYSHLIQLFASSTGGTDTDNDVIFDETIVGITDGNGQICVTYPTPLLRIQVAPVVSMGDIGVTDLIAMANSGTVTTNGFCANFYHGNGAPSVGQLIRFNYIVAGRLP